MAMQQLQLQSQKHSASWLKLFPRDIKTLAGSTIFVKQLTALSFSCITYMRSMFPEYAYQQREVDDVKVKILSGNYDCKDAYLMTRWIKSAFSALDHKYMRELVLEILSDDNKPLEYYAVVYKYNENGPSCSISINSKDIDFDLHQLQDATKQLIKTLLTVTESLEELPEKYILQLRVNYYDEITPSHYKPKYFIHSEANSLKEIDYMKHQDIGSVETPYLAMSIYSGSKLVSHDDNNQSFFKDMEVENSQNIIEESDVEVEHSVKTERELEPISNLDKSAKIEVIRSHNNPKHCMWSEGNNLLEKDDMQHHDTGSVKTPPLAKRIYYGSKENNKSFFKDLKVANSQNLIEESDVEVEENSTIEHSMNTDKMKTGDSDKQESEPTWNLDGSANSEEDLAMSKTQIIPSSEPNTVNCMCGHNYKNHKESVDSCSDTFQCFHCNSLHHLICYKKIPGNRDFYVKCCYACAKSPDHSPPLDCTDPSLLKYKHRQAKHLAIYRQMIYRFQNKKCISSKSMTDLGVQSDLAENVMTKLNKDLFIKPKKNSKNLFNINKARIKHFIKSYFEL